MNKKILCLVSGSEGYGVRQVWSSLIDGMTDKRWTVIIAVLDQRHAAAWMAEFPSATVVSPDKSVQLGPTLSGSTGRYASMFRRGLVQVKLFRWLVSVAKVNDVNNLLFQGPLESALAGLTASHLGMKAYWFVPNAVDTTKPLDVNRRIYRALFQKANVIPVSNSNYTDSTFGLGKFERHVVHLGVDVDHYRPGFDPTLIRNQFGIPHDAPLIGLFARMHPSKGQIRLVEALATSAKEIHVILCGGPTEGSYFELLNRRISKLGLKSRVHIAGPQSDLRSYYAACDIIASLLDGVEGFGLTLVEGMACAKPAFAHIAGGPGETVLDGQTGWLIPNAGSDAISTGLNRIMADRPNWKKMGDRGRERAVLQFSKEQFQSTAVELLSRESKSSS